MIVTKQEAKELWCNKFNSGGGMNYGFRTGISEVTGLEKNLPLYSCIGDGCMDWRWYNKDRGFCGRSGNPVLDNPHIKKTNTKDSKE